MRALEDLWQLHYSLADVAEHNVGPRFITNDSRCSERRQIDGDVEHGDRVLPGVGCRLL
jgi:hypothetical protein